MSSLLELLDDVIMEEVELSKDGMDKDFETSSGLTFVKEGCHKVVIERGFLKQTKSGGVSFTLHTKGSNVFQGTIFPFSKDKKTKKLTTVNTYNGKSSTNTDFKLLKQLIYLATGSLIKEISEIEKEEQDIEYKQYGKVVKETVVVIPSLEDKELHIGIRRKAKYFYDKEAEENDKTKYATDDEGNLRYDYTLYSSYNADGLSAEEFVKEQEATKMKSEDEWLRSDKGIYKPKLEESDEPTVVEETSSDDDLDF